MENFFDGIILDIDGTIWNTTGIVAVAWNKAIDQTGLNARKINAQDLQNEFGKTMDEIAKDLWPELDDKSRDILLAECVTEEQIAVRNNSIDICYEGVVDTIRELSSSQNFYVVSNCQDGYIELMLEKTGLGKYVKDFECFGRTGKGKAENIMILCSRNGIKAPVYVGDTQTDSNACNQCGVPFIYAAYGFGKAASYIEKISSFPELARIIRK